VTLITVCRLTSDWASAVKSNISMLTNAATDTARQSVTWLARVALLSICSASAGAEARLCNQQLLPWLWASRACSRPRQPSRSRLRSVSAACVMSTTWLPEDAALPPHATGDAAAAREPGSEPVMAPPHDVDQPDGRPGRLQRPSRQSAVAEAHLPGSAPQGGTDVACKLPRGPARVEPGPPEAKGGGGGFAAGSGGRLLFEKVLTSSDVSGPGRVVVPKVRTHAERRQADRLLFAAHWS